MLRKKAVKNLVVANILPAAPVPPAFVAPTAEEISSLEEAARGKNILLSDDALGFITEKARAEKVIASEVLSLIAAKIGAGTNELSFAFQ